jgi:hypothetical protein
VKILLSIRWTLATSLYGSPGAYTGAAANGPPQPKGLGLPLCLDCGHALTASASTLVVIPAQALGLELESSPLDSYRTTRGCRAPTTVPFLKKHRGLVPCRTGLAREIDPLFAVEVVSDITSIDGSLRNG